MSVLKRSFVYWKMWLVFNSVPDQLLEVRTKSVVEYHSHIYTASEHLQGVLQRKDLCKACMDSGHWLFQPYQVYVVLCFCAYVLLVFFILYIL